MMHLRPRLMPLTSAILLATLALGIILALGHGRWLVADWYGAIPIYPGLLRVGLALAILGVYGAGVRLLYRGPAGLLVVWSVLGSAAVTLGLLGLTGSPLNVLFACVNSRGCTGGYSASLLLTPDFLRQWPRLMLTWPDTFTHLATQAPGWPLLYRAVARLLERAPGLSTMLSGVLRPLRCNQWAFLALPDSQVASAWLGIASPLWAGLTAIPLYFLGRASGDREVARTGVSWWPLLPAPAIFAATLSNVYELFAVTTVAFFWSGLVAPRRWQAAVLLGLSGMVIGGALLLNFSLTPILMLCGVLALCWGVRKFGWRPAPIIWLATAAMVVFGLGLLCAWGLFWIKTGLSPFELFIVAMHNQTGREWSYVSGLVSHSWDFALFAGLPVVGLALAPLVDRRLRPITCLGIATGVTILATLLSGTARGEVGRVWIFFMPLVLLVASAALVRLQPAERRWLVAAQAVWLVALAATFNPVNSRLPDPPAYASVAWPALSAATVPADATFGDALHLAGYQAEYDPGKRTLTVALHWQALAAMDRAYHFSAVLVAPNGRVLPAVNWQPFASRYPTTCWGAQAGTRTPIIDRIELPLGSGAMPGDWWLSLSAFEMAGDERGLSLPVALPGAVKDSQVGLGPLRVPQ